MMEITLIVLAILYLAGCKVGTALAVLSIIEGTLGLISLAIKVKKTIEG